MLSMCGLICRFLRGWRQSEAAYMMIQAASLSDASLVVEDLATLSASELNSDNSLFCQPLCHQEKSVQMLWKDNNKQATILVPKETVDLVKWRRFCPHSTNKEENVEPSALSEVEEENPITVLLEASCSKPRREHINSDFCLMVEDLAELLAWQIQDVVGIIIRTSPSKLVSMIQAFFQDSLVIDDSFYIRKMLTVKLRGEPLPISESSPTADLGALFFKSKQCKSCNIGLTQGAKEGASSSSNPNLTRIGSPFIRGIPQSSSFTSSPFRRPQSVASNSSPIKRGFCSNIVTPGLDSPAASPLVEEDEEFELAQANIDQANERPPNILVYTSNNHEYFEAVSSTLENTLNRDRYVIYNLTDEMAFKSPWAGSTTLLVVCGDVPTHVSTVFIRYLLDGGRVLSICSDFLNVAIPLFAFKLPWTSSLVESGTVEVQDASIVSISYNKWKNVQILHHQHCFHSSPKIKRFSQDLEKKRKANSGSAISVEPNYVEITDEYGVHHRLSLEVLAKDDTWGAPSLLVADVHNGAGKAIFSQVHLERDPQSCISLGLTPEQLKLSDEHRCGILKHLLSDHLGLDVTTSKKNVPAYTPAYLLGRHDIKQEFLIGLKPFLNENMLERNNLTLKLCDGSEKYAKASQELLPILASGCPNNFSTVKYFEVLKTNKIGRIMIYSEVMTSTMNLLRGRNPLSDGIAIVCTQQTKGIGRGGNLWVSPLGSAMISLQLHLSVGSNLSQRLPFLQHLVSLACIAAIKSSPGYEELPFGLKWPNDIYILNGPKIGGVLVEASTSGSNIIVNIGCGLNLANSNPTACINDIISKFNKENGTQLKEMEREAFLAMIFNHLELLIGKFQEEGPSAIIPEYYKHWMHENASVTVQNEQKESQRASIVGVDDFGFLLARMPSSGEIISLHPDGNSFNMLEGLIYTKHK